MKYVFNSVNSIILSILILTACDTIPENERSVFSEKKSIEEIEILGRTVLLEDYTGIWCPNCPPAAATALEIQQILSKNVLIIVSIHAGVFSPLSSPFNTSAGDEYQKKFYPENGAYPAGIISRTKFNGKLVNISANGSTWKTDILTKLFSEIPDIKLSLQNHYNTVDSTLTIKSSVISNENKNKI
ncbi:MAG: hypothetical protein LBN11_05030 [Tannerella sp.]|nr:hypothetical protein [Tannerella sp.]